MLKPIILAAALLASATPVFAQAGRPAPSPAGTPSQKQGTSDDEKACKGDAIKLCPDVIGNNMAVLACFKQNRTKLSPACTGVLRGYGQL